MTPRCAFPIPLMLAAIGSAGGGARELRAQIADQPPQRQAPAAEARPQHFNREVNAVRRPRMAAVVARPRAVGVVAKQEQIKQRAPQYEERFRPVLFAELEFIRQHSELPPEARRQIRAAGDAALQQAVLAYLEWRYIPELRANRPQPNVTLEIQRRLADAMNQVLTPEQRDRFAQKLAERNELRKGAAIRTLVTTLDERLLLTEDQRQKLAGSIGAKWQPDWEGGIEILNYDRTYVPAMPEQLLATHLTEDQMTVWRSMQKVSFTGGLNLMRTPKSIDEAWWTAEPAGDTAPAVPPPTR